MRFFDSEINKIVSGGKLSQDLDFFANGPQMTIMQLLLTQNNENNSLNHKHAKILFNFRRAECILILAINMYTVQSVNFKMQKVYVDFPK